MEVYRRLEELIEWLTRVNKYLVILYILLMVLGVMYNYLILHSMPEGRGIGVVISGETLISLGLVVALGLGYGHLKNLSGREIGQPPLKITVEVLVLTLVISIYNALEESYIIPKETVFGVLDDFLVPWLYYNLVIILYMHVLILGEHTRIRSVFEKIYGLYGLLISLIPVAVVGTAATHGDVFTPSPSVYIIGDSAAAAISLILAYYYMARLWSYRLTYTYVDLVDVFLFFSGSFAFFSWADLLENYVVRGEFYYFLGLIKVTGLILIGVMFLLVVSGIINMHKTVRTLKILGERRELAVTAGGPILVKFDISDPIYGYIRVAEYINFIVRTIYRIKDPDKLFFILIMKPNSQIYKLIMRSTYRSSPKFIGLVLLEKMKIEEAGRRDSETIYYLPSIAIHIVYFIRKGLQAAGDRNVLIIIDNIADLMALSGAKEVYLLLRSLQGEFGEHPILVLYPEGTMTRQDENLVTSLSAKIIEL